ncbi:MAG: hypothetical protein CMJ32_09605 [Phycisphaerae bacterium]|nr:hypothetical protein [Phycisphaerae bacterium]
MARLFAIARRDTAGCFLTPVAWIIMALASLLSALVFIFISFRQGEPATLRAVISSAGWILIVVAPAITMRSISEELRLGTWETLMTSPVSSAQVILGKLLACLAVLAAVIIVPLIPPCLVLELYGRPDYGELLCGVLGLLLSGLVFISFGLLFSSFTSSQVVSYLGCFFFWVLLMLVLRGLPTMTGPDLGQTLLSIDPLGRLHEFTIGLLDSANIIYFLAWSAAAIVFCILSIELRRIGYVPYGVRGFAITVKVFMFSIAIVGIATVLVMIGSRPQLELMIDATKTRAYTLTGSTEDLVRGLDPQRGWSITLVVPSEEVDAATLRQVDEVLRRMQAVNPAIAVRSIDPDDPEDLIAWEELLEELETAYESQVGQWQETIEDGLVVLDELQRFCIENVAMLAATDDLATTIDQEQLQSLEAALGQMATGAGAYSSAVEQMVQPSDSHPIGDLDGARSALVANHEYWGQQFQLVADLFQQSDADVVDRLVENYQAMSRTLLVCSDRLRRLPELDLLELTSALQSGSCAIIRGGDRAVVVESWQIFPMITRGDSDMDVVRMDMRFRGEEVLGWALRAIDMEQLPQVVFVHAEQDSLLKSTASNEDLFAIADLLRSSRFDVTEWSVTDSSRPVLDADRPVTWIIMPPLRRTTHMTTPEERSLVEAATQLLQEGESLLVCLSRSPLPMIGQVDPWAELLEGVGIDARTGTVILEQVATAEDQRSTRQLQLIQEYPESPLSPAIEGRQLVLSQPVPIMPLTDDAFIVAAVQPGPARWLEDDPRSSDVLNRQGIPPGKLLTENVPVAVGVQRSIPGMNRPQRLLVVGSGGWLLSALADITETLGGGRLILANPGNKALASASVAWLSGLDELVVAGASGREVSRLSGITDGARKAWGIILILAVPAFLVGTGATILSRRSSA